MNVVQIGTDCVRVGELTLSADEFYRLRPAAPSLPTGATILWHERDRLTWVSDGTTQREYGGDVRKLDALLDDKAGLAADLAILHAPPVPSLDEMRAQATLAFNSADQALATESEGHSASSTTYSFMLWRDDTAKLLYRRNAANSGWEIIQNYGAAVDPTVDEDSGDGYGRGALWINTSGNKVFICTNPASGAAVWKELGLAASGTQAFGTISVSGQADVVADATPDQLTLVGSNGVTITTTLRPIR